MIPDGIGIPEYETVVSTVWKTKCAWLIKCLTFGRSIFKCVSLVFSATWYAITGIVLGCLAFVVGMSVVAYKCYRRYGRQRSGRDGQNRLSSAIKKGLKEQNNSSMKKSPSLKSTQSGRSRGSESGSPAIQVCDRNQLLFWFMLANASCSIQLSDWIFSLVACLYIVKLDWKDAHFNIYSPFSDISTSSNCRVINSMTWTSQSAEHPNHLLLEHPQSNHITSRPNAT